MAEDLARSKAVFSIRQHITAGSNWTGVIPTTVRAWANWIFSYPTDTVGGLFRPYNLALYGSSQAMKLVGFEFMGGAQATWSLSLVDADSKVQVLYSGTTDTSFVSTESSAVVLQIGEELRLVSAGASGAMLAKCKFAPYEV